MGTKTGLLIGFAAGYVLGTRAGRDRYEQILQAWGRVTGSPAVQRVAEKTKDAAGTGARRGLYAVQRGVGRAGGAVRDRLHRDEDPTASVAGRLAEQSGAPPGENANPIQEAGQVEQK